jgi:hypothetical protein
MRAWFASHRQRASLPSMMANVRSGMGPASLAMAALLPTAALCGASSSRPCLLVKRPLASGDHGTTDMPMGNALLSIVSGTLPLALFGSQDYGKMQGRMMSSRLIVSTTAPFVLALVLEWIVIIPSLTLVVAVSLLAMGLLSSLIGVGRPRNSL